MSANDSTQLYQQLILDHNRSPKNFRALTKPTHKAEGYNPLCGDRYQVYLKVNDAGVIEEASFEGQGCAISKASASIMTESVRGKSIEEASALFSDFRALLKGDQRDLTQLSERLGKLKIFSGIWQYPARVKCAALSWHALQAAMEEKTHVSTE